MRRHNVNFIKIPLDKSITKYIKSVGFILLLIIVLGVVLRVYHLEYRSIWKDEAYQYYAATKDLKAIRDLGHPLLSHYIVHFFLLLDTRESMLRMPSVIFGIGSIILIYLVAKMYFDWRTALLSAFFVTISPFLIYYSQEGRMYSQLVFMTLLSIYFMILSIRDDKLFYYIGYVIFTALCLHTHFFAAFVLLVENIFIIFTILLKIKKLSYWKWLLAQLFILILFIPAILLLLETAREHPRSSENNPLIIALSTFYIFSFGRVLFPINWNSITVFVGALIYCSLFILGVRDIFKKRDEFSVFIGSLALTYLIILSVNSIFSFMGYYHVRYLIFFAPFFYLIVVRGYFFLTNTFAKKLVLAFIIVVNIFALYPYYFQWRKHGKGEYRSVGKFISSQMNEGMEAIVAFSDTYSKDRADLPIKYYLNRSYKYKELGDGLNRLSELDSKKAIVLVSVSEKTIFEVFKSGSVFKDELRINSTIIENIQDYGYFLTSTEIWPGKNRIELRIFNKSF